MTADLTQRIVSIVRAEVGPADESTSLDSLNVDSLELIDLLMRIENSEGIKFPNELISGMNTVGDIARAADALRV